MSREYRKLNLNGPDQEAFSAYLPGEFSEGIGEGIRGIGITENEKPCGAAFYSVDNGVLTLLDLNLEDTRLIRRDFLRIVYELTKQAQATGIVRLECRFCEGDPDMDEPLLREAGFTDFQQEATVYKISSFELGSLLRDGPKARMMREECVKLLDEEELYCYAKLPVFLKELFRELHPVAEHSYMSFDKDGMLSGYAVIARLSDGALYLADICGEDPERLWGLWYICAASVFMELGPEDGLFLAAVDEEIEGMVRKLLDPLIGEVRTRRIILASGEV